MEGSEAGAESRGFWGWGSGEREGVGQQELRGVTSFSPSTGLRRCQQGHHRRAEENGLQGDTERKERKR